MNSVNISTAFAFRLLGAPYIWGGQSMDGCDCSGFVQLVLGASNRDPDGDQTAQSLHDIFVQKSVSTPCEGALAFFGKSIKCITHVGYCISDDQMIEAGGGDRTCITAEIAKKKNACVRISYIARRKDIVGFVYPFI